MGDVWHCFLYIENTAGVVCLRGQRVCAPRGREKVYVPNKGERCMSSVRTEVRAWWKGRRNVCQEGEEVCAQWKGEHREKWLFGGWSGHGKKATQCMGRTREEKWLSGVCAFFYLLPCCPRGQQQFSNIPNMTEALPPTTLGHTRAALSPSPLNCQAKKKINI